MTHVPHPRRLQRKRTKGFRLPKGTRCVTRPHKFGNPFETAEEFDVWMKTGNVPNGFNERDFHNRRITILLHLKNLIDTPVACFCPLSNPCHADVLASMADHLRDHHEFPISETKPSGRSIQRRGRHKKS